MVPTAELHRDRYSAIFRVERPEGSDELVCLILAGDADPDQPWAELSERSLDTWRSALQPLDSTETLGERIAICLDDLGWEAVTDDLSTNRAIPVRRIQTAFRAHGVTRLDGARAVIVMNSAGPLADYDARDEPIATVLANNGWDVVGRLDDWPGKPLRVRVADWPRVITYLRKRRVAAKANADDADHAFRRGLREALFSGQDATALAQLTELTRQRIYQIRDDRR